MRRMITGAAAVAALSILAVGCAEKDEAATTIALPAKTVAPVQSAAPPASASAEPSADDAPAASAIPGAKTFDCGAKGQKLCPMQKWMKTVMAGASSSDDGDRLAEALTYVAKHPPPGFTTWTALAEGGVKKAKAGDIDGAKVSCKQCHEQFKDKYKATLRDRPF